MVTGIKGFFRNEDGAVTVDFVVLTAAIGFLGLAVGGALSSGATTLANTQDSALQYQADRLEP